MVLPNPIYGYLLGVMGANSRDFTIKNTYNPADPQRTVYMKTSGLYMAIVTCNTAVQSYETIKIFYYHSPTNSLYGFGVSGRNPELEVYTPGTNDNIRNVIIIAHSATNAINVGFYIYKLTTLQLASIPNEQGPEGLLYKNTNQ